MFRATPPHQPIASHARGRWFEPSRAHRLTALSVPSGSVVDPAATGAFLSPPLFPTVCHSLIDERCIGTGTSFQWSMSDRPIGVAGLEAVGDALPVSERVGLDREHSLEAERALL